MITLIWLALVIGGVVALALTGPSIISVGSLLLGLAILKLSDARG